VAATVTSETTAATCETAGKTVYTATVAAAASLDKKEHSMTKEVAIAALGHDWNTPLFVWSEDHTSVTAIFICKNNPAHIEKVTASGDAITSKVTTEPTEEKPGVMTYTASVTSPDGKIYTASDTEEIPALENKEVVRIYGQTRYETAIKVADELKAKLGVSEFSTIILAYGSNYADALAGSYLSCILDAPIILVDARQDHIDQAQAYIRKNLKNGGQIYILGGTGVVPESAVAGLSGYKIDRLGGATRYETNIEILKEAAKFSNDNSEILVCSGQNFPDSLSAAATGKPILLVKNALQDGQKTYLKSLGGSMTFTVIGGTGAVSDSVKNELNAYGKTDRVWGLTRYETSTAVAKKYFKNPEQGVIAYGVNFPDGLCGGVLAYNMDAPLLLAANGKTEAAVKYAGESGTTLGAVLGGPTLVSDASVRAILHMDEDSEIIVR
jgi:putative cell wall-binding protein